MVISWHRGGDGGAVVDVPEILGGLHEAHADSYHPRRACGKYVLSRESGALGAVIVGIVVFKEPATAGRIFFASLLLVGIVGLKFTSA